MTDWRRSEDYAYLDGIDRHEWAWEFLRRNPTYRKAYYTAWEFAKIRPRTPEMEPEFLAKFEAATYPYNLDAPVDPALGFAEGKPIFHERVAVKVLEKWAPSIPSTGIDEDWPWPGYPWQVALQFDLDSPLDVQIEIATEILQRFQRRLDEEDGSPRSPRKRPSFHERQFPLYARILDAEIAGATVGSIGRHLFSDKADPRRSVTKARETALYMAREGYRDLLLLPPRRPSTGTLTVAESHPEED
jgi:hypothetical protein